MCGSDRFQCCLMRDLPTVAKGFFKSCEDAFATIVPGNFEPTFASQFAHFTEIGSVVGHEPENAIRTKNSADFREEVFLKNTPTGMPAFRPRIREIKVKSRYTGWRKDRECLYPEALNGCGVGQSQPQGARVAFVHAIGLLFNTKKIRNGMQRSHADQKCTAMAAEVDLQRLSQGLKPSVWNAWRIFR